MYPVIFNRKEDVYSMSDIAEMLDLAICMRNEIASLTDVTIFLRDKQCINSWLCCVPNIRCGENDFSYKNLCGNIQTTRTYKPKNSSKCEIIIAPCVFQSDLEKIQESQSIGVVLVIPEMENQCDCWLIHHSAIDWQTKKEIPNNLSVSSLTNRCIGWLKEEGAKSAPLANDSMNSYVEEASNLLIQKGEVSDFDSIYKQCLKRNLSHREAYKLAKILSSKIQHNLSTKPDYDYLYQWVNDEKWENN